MEKNLIRHERETVDYDRLLKEVLSQHVNDFSASVRSYLEKFISGEAMNDREQMIFRANLESWWSRTFGFNFKDKRRREEKLREIKNGVESGENQITDSTLRLEDNYRAIVAQINEKYQTNKRHKELWEAEQAHRESIKQANRYRESDRRKRSKEEADEAFRVATEQINSKYHLSECREELRLAGLAHRGEVDKIKDKYFEGKGEGIEEIEGFFGLYDFIYKQQEFSREYSKDKNKPFSEVAPRLQDLTEYQFLFTHLLIKNAEDEKWLKNFWATGERVAKHLKSDSWAPLAAGLRSQVAAYWVIKELGHNPRLSSPDEDAFKSIDMWGGGNEVMQIKGYNVEKPALMKTDITGFPAVEVNRGKNSDLYASAGFLEYKQENEKFTLKIKQYSQKLKRELHGYFMVLPNKMINRVNGRPNPELVEFFRREIGEEQRASEVELAA